MPPSTDPPMTRQQRRALARERAKKSLRKPGGQPGHEGKHRQMASPEKVDETFECLPDACSGCGLVFTGGERQDGEPVIHQKWELPPISPLIFEYRLHRVCCPGCAKKTLAGLPAGVSASAFGPRLEAHIAMLAGVYRLSRRQVAQVVEEILGCPISTGAVDTAIMRMSRVLADPWQALAAELAGSTGDESAGSTRLSTINHSPGGAYTTMLSPNPGPKTTTESWSEDSSGSSLTRYRASAGSDPPSRSVAARSHRSTRARHGRAAVAGPDRPLGRNRDPPR